MTTTLAPNSPIKQESDDSPSLISSTVSRRVFWVDNPRVLWHYPLTFTWDGQSTFAERLNAFVRVIIVFAIIMTIYRRTALYLLTIPAAMLITAIYWRVSQEDLARTRAAMTEGFSTGTRPTELPLDPSETDAAPLFYEPMGDDMYLSLLAKEYTAPRKIAQPCYLNRQAGSLKHPEIQKYFSENKMMLDPDDLFGKTQSQRNYVLNPAQMIPPDYVGFARKMYYVRGQTDKERNGLSYHNNKSFQSFKQGMYTAGDIEKVVGSGGESTAIEYEPEPW